MTSATLVLSVVDGRTKVAHLVASDTARRHRQAGRYPALCGENVITASLITEPAADCRQCHHHCRRKAPDN